MKLKGGKKVKHLKVMIDLGQLIGKPFASHWQVVDPKNGDLQEITEARVLTKAYLDEDPFGDAGEADGEDGEDDQEEVKDILPSEEGVKNKDNRDIVDNNQAQKLT